MKKPLISLLAILLFTISHSYGATSFGCWLNDGDRNHSADIIGLYEKHSTWIAIKSVPITEDDGDPIIIELKYADHIFIARESIFDMNYLHLDLSDLLETKTNFFNTWLVIENEWVRNKISYGQSIVKPFSLSSQYASTLMKCKIFNERSSIVKVNFDFYQSHANKRLTLLHSLFKNNSY